MLLLKRYLEFLFLSSKNQICRNNSKLLTAGAGNQRFGTSHDRDTRAHHHLVWLEWDPGACCEVYFPAQNLETTASLKGINPSMYHRAQKSLKALTSHLPAQQHMNKSAVSQKDQSHVLGVNLQVPLVLHQGVQSPTLTVGLLLQPCAFSSKGNGPEPQVMALPLHHCPSSLFRQSGQAKRWRW